MNDVSVIVTGRIVKDKGYVGPYDHRVTPKMQHYRGSNGLIIPDEYVTYEVPLYEVRIVGGGHYNAIRFGLRNRGDNWIPDRRPCDTGLSQPHECVPTFVPYYRPHIEIVDGGWRKFQNEIQSKAGGSCAAIGAAKKLKVTIEYAAYPMAKLY